MSAQQRKFNFEPIRKMDARETREAVIRAFRELHQEGFICRANFMCCGNCAGTAIANAVEVMTKERRSRVLGGVYWHHQAEERLQDCGSWYLNYGPIDSAECGHVGLATEEEVGRRIIEVFDRYDIVTEWNGEGSRAIRVIGCDASVPVGTYRYASHKHDESYYEAYQALLKRKGY